MIAIVSCFAPVICLLCLFGVMDRLLPSRREALLAAAAVFGAVVVLITELTSLLNQFSYLPILYAWTFVDIILICRWLMTSRRLPRIHRPSFVLHSPLPVACCLACALIISLIAILAILSPPNTVDSLTYHMPRVMNWIQHRTVAHYQTHIIRQLYLGPCAEFAVAHLQLLTGTDRLANLPQFFSMIGSVIGVSVIAEQLGAGNTGQTLAALFAATIPIGMLEASSTQTDFVAAFWAVITANFALRLREDRGVTSALREMILGSSIGLAMLTKLTTLFFIAPFLALLLAQRFFGSPRSGIRLALSIGLLALLINAGHLTRNVKAFGRPTAPAQESAMYSNATHRPGPMLCNVLRNLFTNLAMPRCGFLDPLAHRIIPLISRTDVNDPRITFLNEPFSVGWSRHEDYASNPLQIVLGTVCLAAALLHAGRKHSLVIYAACIILAGTLFCWELRWQPWITRLQLPGFVLIAPLVGAMLERVRFKPIVWGTLLALTLNAIYYPLFGSPRCLRGPSSAFRVVRQDQYLAGLGVDTRENIRELDSIITKVHPHVIELDTGANDFEYVVWLAAGPSTLIQHTNPNQDTLTCASFRYTSHPDLIITLSESNNPTRALPLLLENAECHVYGPPTLNGSAH